MKPMPIDPSMQGGHLGVRQRIIDGVRESWIADPSRLCLIVRWDAIKAGRQVTRNVDTELLRATSIDDPRLAAARQAAIDTMLRFD